MKRTNSIITVLFLVFLFGMFYKGVTTLEWEKFKMLTNQNESVLNEALDESHLFIELYGLTQRVTGQRLIEDGTPDTSVTKLDNGTLTFCGLENEYIDPTKNALKTAEFADGIKEMDIPFLVVIAPEKIRSGTKPMPKAIHEYGNEIADRYLSVLEEKEIGYFDLRPEFNRLENYDEMFFRTDHHWKPEGAIYACKALNNLLLEDYGFKIEEEQMLEEHWKKQVYESWFLGSQGKRTGAAYAGTDDFTRYIPEFDTSFTYLIPERNMQRTGTFNDALCFSERIEQRDWYNNNPYTYYSGGDWAYAEIINHHNPDGPRIIMIRDSFSCALTPFLALSCSELITVDLRYYKDDLTAAIEEIRPDLVMLLYMASTTRLENMFEFWKL